MFGPFFIRRARTLKQRVGIPADNFKVFHGLQKPWISEIVTSAAFPLAVHITHVPTRRTRKDRRRSAGSVQLPRSSDRKNGARKRRSPRSRLIAGPPFLRPRVTYFRRNGSYICRERICPPSASAFITP